MTFRAAKGGSFLKCPGNDLVHHLGEMFHLQDVLLGGNVVRSILWRQRRGELGYDLSPVDLIADIVDSHAGLGLAGGLDGLVHVMTVHPDASELRKQGRMEIDDSVRICVNEEIRDHHQEACKDNEVDAELLHYRHQLLLIQKVLPWHHQRRNAVILGANQSIGIRPVAQDQ